MENTINTEMLIQNLEDYKQTVQGRSEKTISYALWLKNTQFFKYTEEKNIKDHKTNTNKLKISINILKLYTIHSMTITKLNENKY